MFLANAVCSGVYSVGCLLGVAQPTTPQPDIQLQTTLWVNKSNSQVPWNLAQVEFESAESYFEEGVLFHRDGQFEQAIQSYQNATRVDPTFDDAYINLGLAYIQINQLDDAVNVFHQVLELPERVEAPASNYTLAHYNLAIIFSRQGKMDEALAEVQQALAITPTFGRAQQLQQQLQSQELR
ncbi:MULTISPECIES: tetratricopeptide repeat protein [unclassified Leptolyngbya]|uniref:tetratricopeptide repeat protein n=1 Tax=unclassified Leptolyngbya TaxID=2650499 RepID=UPI001688DDE7|nr:MULTISPECIES: tetratricopeptide repeat protein [unclassified Leptolyngbya]MBD1912064.1 tetratricopeptide repeat protein [Leptolyngbya sp. FACHB-8]MBD2156564.1 tetratricopeptide repeat protein [Leptolyngbya sp. FACHB-16]